MSTRWTIEEYNAYERSQGRQPLSPAQLSGRPNAKPEDLHISYAPQSSGSLARDIAKASIVKERSPLELQFLELWSKAGGPVLEEEKPLIPGRLFRCDFVLESKKMVYEIEGYGIGHFGKAGFKKDADKYIELYLLGYTVVRLTKHLITPETVARLIAKVL